MNDQNKDNTNIGNNNAEIVDASLLNPFQSNANNINSDNSVSTPNEPVNINNQSFNSQKQGEISLVQNNVNNQINDNSLSSIEKNVINNSLNINNNIQNVNATTTFDNAIHENQNIQPQTPINIQQASINSNTTESEKKSSIIFLVLAIVSVFCFFGKGIVSIVGIVLSVISLIGSIVMIKKKAKLSIASLIISIVVLAIYIFSLVIAFSTVSDYVDQTKASVFRSAAYNLAMGAKQNAIFDNSISCDDTKNKSTRKMLSELSHSYTISPFGGNYDYNKSYVLVEAYKENGVCKYKASIYLTDGTYSLGTSSIPVLDSNIDSTEIKKN